VKFRHVVLEIYERTDRHTDRQTDVHLPVGGVCNGGAGGCGDGCCSDCACLPLPYMYSRHWADGRNVPIPALSRHTAAN